MATKKSSKTTNPRLAQAGKEFRAARVKIVLALCAAKDGLAKEGASLQKYIMSGKGASAFGQATKIITDSFRAHRAETLGKG